MVTFTRTWVQSNAATSAAMRIQIWVRYDTDAISYASIAPIPFRLWVHVVATGQTHDDGRRKANGQTNRVRIKTGLPNARIQRRVAPMGTPRDVSRRWIMARFIRRPSRTKTIMHHD